MRTPSPTTSGPKPILLFNDECNVCRHIGNWVQKSAQGKSGEPSIIVRPIGDDPKTLRSLNPELDIWDAYATIHLLMPDGSMKLGGEAVAELFRRLPNAQWFAWLFAFRPFQAVLNIAYAILSHLRPLFGCESCGAPSSWMKPIRWVVHSAGAVFGRSRPSSPAPHFTSLRPRMTLAIALASTASPGAQPLK
jgi:predicted DCC family thiol-disulfide oxidoreductase YuxK